jgi:hypothetical protein
MAGYSGKPLAEKLGIKAGCRIFVDQAPENYPKLVEPLPEGVTIVPRLADKVDIVHIFGSEAKELAKKLKQFKKSIVENGMIWVSWPKKSAGVPTDVTEDVIREVALPLGLVDVKVCAVDEVWSGLKLVIRRENRKNDKQRRLDDE